MVRRRACGDAVTQRVAIAARLSSVRARCEVFADPGLCAHRCLQEVALGLEKAAEGVLRVVDPQRAVGERGAKRPQDAIGMLDVIRVLLGELEAKGEERRQQGSSVVACRSLAVAG